MNGRGGLGGFQPKPGLAPAINSRAGARATTEDRPRTPETGAPAGRRLWLWSSPPAPMEKKNLVTRVSCMMDRRLAQRGCGESRLWLARSNMASFADDSLREKRAWTGCWPTGAAGGIFYRPSSCFGGRNSKWGLALKPWRERGGWGVWPSHRRRSLMGRRRSIKASPGIGWVKMPAATPGGTGVSSEPVGKLTFSPRSFQPRPCSRNPPEKSRTRTRTRTKKPRRRLRFQTRSQPERCSGKCFNHGLETAC